MTRDEILPGHLSLLQPDDGPRVTLDTILLASWVRLRSKRADFLEAGCATGAIALILAKKFPDRIHVTGLDIQDELIKLAEINANDNNLADKVEFIRGDLRDRTIFTGKHFDGLVINPPYSSLYASRQGNSLSRSTARLELTCTLDDVGNLGRRVLKSNGRLFAIFTSERLDVFIASMLRNRLIPKKLKPVYPDVHHNSGVFLIECVKDGGEGMTIYPPLIIRDENKHYTRELLQAYEINNGGFKK